MRPQDGSAQRRVVPPKGLDLNASLSTVFDEADDEEEDVDDGSGEDGLYRGKGAGLATEDMTITAKEKDEVRALSAKIFGQMEVDENGRDGGKDGKGKPKRENTLFYLGDDTPSKSKEVHETPSRNTVLFFSIVGRGRRSGRQATEPENCSEKRRFTALPGFLVFL